MFSHIKTSEENKDVVTKLTNKLNLGAENVIARMAIAHSLAQDEKLDIKNIKDAKGKDYAKSVLFGDNEDIYIGMICTRYGLYKSDKDLGKYVKLHLDEGLTLLNAMYEDNPNVDGFEFLVGVISPT